MIVGINASFLRKIDSGTGQVTVNFLRQLARRELKKDASARRKFFLYLEEDFSWEKLGLDKEEGESLFEKRIFLPKYRRDDLIRKIWWEKWLLPVKAEKDGCRIFFSLYQSATVFKNGKIRHLMLVHDVIWKIFPQYLNNLRKKFYYFLVDGAIVRADRILTISLSSQRDLEKFFPLSKDKIKVAAIDCDQVFKKGRRQSEESKTILKRYGIDQPGFIFYVGGFDRRKNIGFLLEAYGRMWEKYGYLWEQKGKNFPDLVLAGKFNRNLVPLVENLPEKITWVAKKFSVPKNKIKRAGFVAQEDLPAFYSLAGLFVFPSLYEGFGLPPLEAFHCDCPVLTNRNSSLEEVVGEGGQLSFLMDDPGKTAQKMAEILTDEKKTQAMLEQGRKRRELFDWEKFVGKVEEEWSALLK